MALNKTQLTAALQAIFEDLDPSNTAASKAIQMADVIDAFVKSGSVTIPSGTVFTSQPGTFGVT